MASALDSMKSLFVDNAVVVAFADAMNSFSERRAKLGLSNPGTVDNLSREVQMNTLIPPGALFSGIKGDITKQFSLAPFFQVSHQFALEDRNPPYMFNTLYGTNNVFLQGSVDNKGTLSGRFNYRWHDKLMTKTQMSLATEASMAQDMAQDMAQIENEYVGDDFTASLKMINPSVLNGGVSGIFIGSYLQSVTSKLGLGLETVWQRTGSSQPPDTAVSLCARYKAMDWIATTQLQSQGALSATYWRRIAENVQAGADLTLAMAPPSMSPMGPVGPTKEGRAQVGVKWDFRMASMRAQVDSKGKIGVLIEKRVAPVVALTFSTELDHSTQQAKVGLGVSLELPTAEVQEQQETMGALAAPNIPF